MTAIDNQRLIEALAPHLPGGHVQHDSLGTWEWRGALYERPTRVQAEGAACRVKVDASNPFGAFTLQWSPRYVPDPGAIDGEAFDVTDEVCVWVGRCVVLKCFGLELPQQVAGLRAFPAEGLQYLIQGMQRDQVSVLAVEPDELVGFMVRDNPDVLAATARFANLLAWTSAQLARVSASAPPPAAPPRALRAEDRLRCRYCRALFLLDALGRCPQCGAPAG
jgi:hypothetical protein